jgi:hypothetical protein
MTAALDAAGCSGTRSPERGTSNQTETIMSNNAKTNRPTHLAYTVREYEKDGAPESDWTRIGAAWQHKDGQGFDIQLEAFPVTGRVTLRANKPKR